jgi:hypothetical protein
LTGKSLRETATTHMTGEELVKWMDRRRGRGVRVARADDGRYRRRRADSSRTVHPEADRAVPERLFFECNVYSIPPRHRSRGCGSWSTGKERDARLCKVYQPEDTAPLNDRAMYPFYEKAQELGVPLTVHTGMSYVVPQPSKYTLPILLDDICLDFPDLKIIAYHAGGPYSEELFAAGKHRNLYVSFSGIIGWMARTPYRLPHGRTGPEWAGPSKIVSARRAVQRDPRIVDWVRNLEMPEELREKWGCEITARSARCSEKPREADEHRTD